MEKAVIAAILFMSCFYVSHAQEKRLMATPVYDNIIRERHLEYLINPFYQAKYDLLAKNNDIPGYHYGKGNVMFVNLKGHTIPNYTKKDYAIIPCNFQGFPFGKIQPAFRAMRGIY